MNLLRGIALLLAVGVVSLTGTLAHAQQEVDPDHFDGPAVQTQKGAPVHHRKSAHSTVAKKGSAKHHRTHSSA